MAKAARVKGEWKRLTVQAAGFLLMNPKLHHFFLGRIETGGTKTVCVPGLNCYSCPAAVGACPVGALQNSLVRDGKIAFPFYVLGFLLLFGLAAGRWICGWLCPFGLVQDLVYRIPFFKKIRTFRFDRYLRAIKYAVLILLVIVLPIVSALKGVLVPWFCKVLCPSGTLFAGIPTVLAAPSVFRLGFLFWWKIGVLLALLLLSLLISRPFCRYLCPLGAIYGLFNKIALTRLDFTQKTCVTCGKCETVCPMSIDPKTRFDSAECIRCGRCVRVCPAGSLSLRFGLRKKEESHK